MKKAIAILLPALACLLLTGCGGNRLEAITATECFTGETLSITYPVDGVVSPHGTSFDARLPPKELRNELAPRMGDYEATLYHRPDDPPSEFEACILLSRQDGGFTAYFLILRLPSYQYYFTDMQVDLGHYNCSFPLPYHLLAKKSLWDTQGRLITQLREGALYETAASPEEFYDFYESINRYELEQTADGFRINGYTESTGDTAVLPKLEHSVSFHFMTVETYSYVYLTVD